LDCVRFEKFQHRGAVGDTHCTLPFFTRPDVTADPLPAPLRGRMTNAHIPRGPGPRAREAGSLHQRKSAPRRARRDRPMATEEVNKIVEQMGSRIGANSGLGGTVKIDFGDPGSVYIDGKSDP